MSKPEKICIMTPKGRAAEIIKVDGNYTVPNEYIPDWAGRKCAVCGSAGYYMRDGVKYVCSCAKKEFAKALARGTVIGASIDE